MTTLISSSGPIKGYAQILRGSCSSPWIAVRNDGPAYHVRELAEGESLRDGEVMYVRQENGEYLEAIG